MNWRERTEQSGYRVVFLPDNRTLSADMIAGVHLAEALPPDPSINYPGCARRVLIDVFALLTEAHVRAQTAGGAS